VIVTATTVLEPRYVHLSRLSDGRGVFEHAQGDSPRPEHGYCVDDVGRALMIITREPGQTPQLQRLATGYLRYLVEAIEPDGRSRNRRSVAGSWAADPGVGDWWGRSLWGLGVAAARSSSPRLRAAALDAFHVLAQQRTVDVRAMAYAALGAGELVLAGNRDPDVHRLLVDCVEAIPRQASSAWDWPEERLRYANGSLAEAVILAGQALGDAALLERGLDLLDVLVRLETRDGHISVTGTAGRGPLEHSPQFDQQPIEVAAIADAAARAFGITGDARWRQVVERCWAWFLGDNDVGVMMVDLDTGAGYDGLEAAGRNDNRGAESTLAALGTWQQAARLGVMLVAS